MSDAPQRPRIPVCGTRVWGNEAKYLAECVRGGWFSAQGEFVRRFEAMLAGATGTAVAATEPPVPAATLAPPWTGHGIACSSATAGLYTALKVLGIGPGDEVIIPDFTIIVSASTVILAGAKPVLVDVEPDTWCLDPTRIEAAITPRTRAIMAVHMYGHPAALPELRELARRHRLALIEDCAEAHGATLGGRPVGSFGEFGVFSFYANKILTCGEGGMLVTGDAELARRARLFISNSFAEPRFKHDSLGFNFRLSNLQAAVGLAQAEHLAEAVARKRALAARYLARLRDCPALQLPVERPGATNVYWMFGIVLTGRAARTKDEVMRELAAQGIETRSFFYGMHEQPVFRAGGDPRYPETDGSWPVSARLGARGLYLPSGLDLADAQVDEVADRLLALVSP